MELRRVGAGTGGIREKPRIRKGLGQEFKSPSLSSVVRLFYPLFQGVPDSSNQRTGTLLSPARRATLDALARVVVPHAYSGAEHGGELSALLERRLSAAPPDIARDIARLLDLFRSPVAALVISRRFRPLAELPVEARAAAFEAWGVSGLPLARTAHQALRRFVLTTYYATTEARAGLPLRPPLHSRAPAVSWEGPVPGGRTLDSEPVARVPLRDATVPGSIPAPRPIPGAVTLGASLRSDTRLTADVVVIGSGAGGAVAAARLAEAGKEVVILEEGEYLHAPDFTENEEVLLPRLFADQAMRTTLDASISLLQGGAVGGGTTVNWMLMLRTPNEVLYEWEYRHGIHGLGPSVLRAEFERIEEEVHARTVPADAHSPSNAVILKGARTLGWRASAIAINASECVRAGTCSLGCRYDAKQSALLTYLPRAFAAGARLLADVRVERIEVAEREKGKATRPAPLKRVHAVARDPQTGQDCAAVVVEAPVVVLAAGAVGTPIILQRSGLGGGGVGHYLRLHPTSGVMGRYTTEMYPVAGIPQSTMCDEFIRRGNGYGFWIECPALQPAFAAGALGSFGAAHRQMMVNLRHLAALIVLVRDGSEGDLSQGTVRMDKRGRVRIRYRLGRAEIEYLLAGVEAATRLHLAAGAAEVTTFHTPPIRIRNEGELWRVKATGFAPNRMSLFSAHLNGTCRMGRDPATSGTTSDGERHGVRGLFVFDGSLLPTSLGVNPQETIMALASLLSQRIGN